LVEEALLCIDDPLEANRAQDLRNERNWLGETDDQEAEKESCNFEYVPTSCTVAFDRVKLTRFVDANFLSKLDYIDHHDDAKVCANSHEQQFGRANFQRLDVSPFLNEHCGCNQKSDCHCNRRGEDDDVGFNREEFGLCCLAWLRYQNHLLL
jgi:hypothetical protein